MRPRFSIYAEFHDVPAKLAAWQAEEYYETDGAQRLVEAYGGKGVVVETVPEAKRDEFEAELDYYYGACVNLRNSRAIPPNKLIGGSTT